MKLTYIEQMKILDLLNGDLTKKISAFPHAYSNPHDYAKELKEIVDIIGKIELNLEKNIN